jgi:DNA-binding transcriptional MerR regulator
MQMRRAQHERRQPRPPGSGLTIGQLAEQSGVSAKAIRYYESIGLLPQPSRGENRYRRYGVADVNRLCLLRRIRLLGLSLSLAKPLLAGASEARCADVQRQLLALVERRLRAIDQEIAELRTLRADVEGYQRRLEACHIETREAFSACMDMSCIALPSEQEGQEGEEADGCEHNSM